MYEIERIKYESGYGIEWGNNLGHRYRNHDLPTIILLKGYRWWIPQRAEAENCTLPFLIFYDGAKTIRCHTKNVFLNINGKKSVSVW